EVSALRDEVATVLALPWVDDGASADDTPRTAYEWFLFAQQLEDEWGGAPADTEGMARARHPYDTALDHGPGLAGASLASGCGSPTRPRSRSTRAWPRPGPTAGGSWPRWASSTRARSATRRPCATIPSSSPPGSTSLRSRSAASSSTAQSRATARSCAAIPT